MCLCFAPLEDMREMNHVIDINIILLIYVYVLIMHVSLFPIVLFHHNSIIFSTTSQQRTYSNMVA